MSSESGLASTGISMRFDTEGARALAALGCAGVLAARSCVSAMAISICCCCCKMRTTDLSMSSVDYVLADALADCSENCCPATFAGLA